MVYGPPMIAEHLDVTTEDVIVRSEVAVAQVRGGLPERAHGAAVAAHLGLGKDHTDIHVASLPRCGRAVAAGQETRPGSGRPGNVSS